MNRLHNRTDIGSQEARKEGREPRSPFSKWMLAAGGAAAFAISCSDVNVTAPIPIPSKGAVDAGASNGGKAGAAGTDLDGGAVAVDGGSAGIDSGGAAGTDSGGSAGVDGGACNAPDPVCTKQSVSGLLSVGNRLPIGDYAVVLEDTGEAKGEQQAVFDIRDACDQAVADDEAVNESGSKLYSVTGTPIRIRVEVSSVTVSGQKQARVSASMECEGQDTVDSNGGNGGADAGAAGDTGTISGGGTDTAGAGGTDSGFAGDSATDTAGSAGTDSGGSAGTDSGPGCIPLAPVCSEQTVSAVVNGGGVEKLPIGDFAISLELNFEQSGEQVAIVDLRNVCGTPVVNDVAIRENTTATMVAVPGEIEVDVKAEQVTIGNQTARLTAKMRCPGDTHDGGAGGTDSGGYAGDSATEGGSDTGGNGGTDSSGGNQSDGGADTSTGGTDSGGYAGDTSTDGGHAGTDTGSGGIDTGGQTNDGGDGGTDAITCTPAKHPEQFAGLIYSGSPQEIGGYHVDYLGKSRFTLSFGVLCAGDSFGNPMTFQLGSGTSQVDSANGRTISISAISAGDSVVNARISVE